MFADRYINKNIVYPEFIDAVVSPEVSMIVMIPCLNEPEIFRTLESLWTCDPIVSCCEAIVVVNESENSSLRLKTLIWRHTISCLPGNEKMIGRT